MSFRNFSLENPGSFWSKKKSKLVIENNHKKKTDFVLKIQNWKSFESLANHELSLKNNLQIIRTEEKSFKCIQFVREKIVNNNQFAFYLKNATYVLGNSLNSRFVPETISFKSTTDIR